MPSPNASDLRYVTFSLMPIASSFLQNASRSFTSKPMCSMERPVVPITGSGEGEKFSATPGRSATRKVPPRHGLRAEDLLVPRAHLGVLRAEEMDVVQRDRRRLLLVLEQLHLHIVGAHDERDRRVALTGAMSSIDLLRGATSDRVMIG